MRPRGLIVFVLLNIIISVGVAFFIIQVVGPQFATSGQPVATSQIVSIIVTATPDPNATLPVRIITATPLPGSVAGIPADVLEDLGSPSGTGTPPSGTAAAGTPNSAVSAQARNTIAPEVLEGDAALQATVAALPPNCIPHTLESGENPALLAFDYGTDVNSILLANGLNEDDAAFLQIGQVLIIPLEGCPLEQFIDVVGATEAAATAETGEGTEEADTGDEGEDGTPEDLSDEDLTATATAAGPTATPTATPTITLVPTAQDAQVEILEVVGAGDVTAESVVVYNNGQTVALQGWTLTDLDGNEYVFGDQRLFNDSQIEIFTRVGQDTAVVKFWGLDEAVWQPGDVVTLTNADGDVQATMRIPSPITLD